MREKEIVVRDKVRRGWESVLVLVSVNECVSRG